jgi:hypothetical protein
MQLTVTQEWVLTATQTDCEWEDVPSTQQMAVTYAQVTNANSTTGDVSVRLGFGTATLPTVTNDSATGNPGVFLSHGGISPGGGVVAQAGGAVLALGAPDEDLRVTCSAATGGSVRIVITYRLIDV